MGPVDEVRTFLQKSKLNIGDILYLRVASMRLARLMKLFYVHHFSLSILQDHCPSQIHVLEGN